MNSTGIRDGGPYSSLDYGKIVGFETNFVKHETEEHNLLSERNQLGEKCTTTKISFENISVAKKRTCIIEYDNDKSLEIKEEVLQETGTDPERNKKYQSDLCTADIREDDILVCNKLPTRKRHKIQESRKELERKYKCEKCARTYKLKRHLTFHQKFSCGIKPQFGCTFCDKQFKWKSVFKRHVDVVHLKKNSKTSETKHNCDKCSRSYTSTSALNLHRRLKHSAVKPQFTCDVCGHNSKEKGKLSRHISSQHLSK